MKPEVYVSLDIETDGQVAGRSNLLSLGAVAYLEGQEIDSFYATVTRQSCFRPDPSTMEWWKGFPREWEEATSDAREPDVVFLEFAAWLKELPGIPVACASPAAWDFSFVWYYLMCYAGECPFSHRALDIRTYAMAALGSSFMGDKNAKKEFLKFRTYKANPPHDALEDAREQGQILMNLMAWRKEHPPCT